jgi:hypothetical protein
MELICLKLKEKGDEKQREHGEFYQGTVSFVSLSLQLPAIENFIRLPAN